MNRRQDLLSLHSHQDRPAPAQQILKTSGLRVASHHLTCRRRCSSSINPGTPDSLSSAEREPELFEIDGPLVGQIRVDKHLALPRQHLVLDSPARSWSRAQVNEWSWL
jgi:hypothetical protein